MPAHVPPAPVAAGPAAPAVAVVDYHKGNLSSVARGLEAAGARPLVTDDPAAIAGADAVVLPGVGSFGDASAFMRESGQAEAVRASIDAGAPFLGICLGMQLLFERGDEVGHAAPAGSTVEGLGVLRGSCARLASTRLKVPHVGWDQLDLTPVGERCPILAGVGEGRTMYFTHSFALADDVDPAVVCARTHYVRSFASVVWRDNVFGCQFHPEKSSGAGASILEAFVGVARAA